MLRWFKRQKTREHIPIADVPAHPADPVAIEPGALETAAALSKAAALPGPQEFATQAAAYRQSLAEAKTFDELRELWRTTAFPYQMNERDPFSATYRAEVLALYEMLVQSDYNVQNELTSTHLKAEDFAVGYPWTSKNLGVVASELGKAVQGFRVIAEHCPGATSVIEFGAGWGNSAIPLARAGLDVTAVDIDLAFLQRIEREAEALSVGITTVNAEFLEAARGVDRRYDVALFSSSFHHCLEFQELLRLIHRHVLTENGCICFFAEPVSNGFTFPWGLRYDGEAVWAITCNKWLELGFSEDFFRDILGRTGFSVQPVPDNSGLLGLGWVARKI